jgi:hypothetical protein
MKLAHGILKYLTTSFGTATEYSSRCKCVGTHCRYSNEPRLILSDPRECLLAIRNSMGELEPDTPRRSYPRRSPRLRLLPRPAQLQPRSLCIRRIAMVQLNMACIQPSQHRLSHLDQQLMQPHLVQWNKCHRRCKCRRERLLHGCLSSIRHQCHFT